MGKSLNSRAKTRRTRALSVLRAFLQSRRLAAGLLLFGAAASAGELSTARRGDYVCENPGDAMGLVGLHVPSEDFSILHASSYAVNGQRGTYLLVGATLTMTSGPMQGNRYRQLSENILHKLNADGSDSPLRCIRSVLNNKARRKEG